MLSGGSPVLCEHVSALSTQMLQIRQRGAWRRHTGPERTMCSPLTVPRLGPGLSMGRTVHSGGALLVLNHPVFDAHLLSWEGGVMPKKYDAQTRARAIRLVTEHRDDYPSEHDAIRTVAGRLGMNPETLRKWLRQAESMLAMPRAPPRRRRGRSVSSSARMPSSSRPSRFSRPRRASSCGTATPRQR